MYIMIDRIQMTTEEKITMYNQFTKEELIYMLIECNRILEMYSNRGVTIIGSGQLDTIIRYNEGLENKSNL